MKEATADVETRFRQLMMARSPADRLAMACRMFATAKILVQAGIRQECGDLPPDQLRRQLFLRLYGRDFPPAEIEKILDSLAP